MAPEGVTFLDDPDETVIATVVVPTEVEEPEIEEETELVGEEVEGEEVEGEEGEPAEGGASPPRRARSPEPLPPPPGRRKADWLVVGWEIPAIANARTRHNIGFEVAALVPSA